MRVAAMAVEYPVTRLDSDALEAARLLATHRLSGLVVTDENGRPHSVLGWPTSWPAPRSRRTEPHPHRF